MQKRVLNSCGSQARYGGEASHSQGMSHQIPKISDSLKTEILIKDAISRQ